MTRNRRWYVQLAFGFLAMLSSMGLVDRYITPAFAAVPQIDLAQLDSTPNPGDDMKIATLKVPDANQKVAPLRTEVPGKIEAEMPEFWVGIRCVAPIPEAIRAHVDIPEGQGLLVVDVVDEGPGKKAGIQQHDILVNAGETPLRSIRDLVNAVEASKGETIELGILRKGEPVSLKVTPEKRPEEMKRRALPSVPTSPDMAKIQRWFEQVQPGQGGKPSMRLRFLHPGMVIPPDATIHPGLPNGLSISISRDGKEPAKINVKQVTVDENGEQKINTWEVTEKELYNLPDDIRPHVERMLNGVIVGSMPQFDFMPSFGPNDKGPIPKTTDALRQQWQQQMQQMQEQMERMDQMMNQMKQRLLDTEPDATP